MTDEIDPPHRALAAELGNIDIYLLDQFLRQRLADRPRVLDAGCGGGRNLVYFLRTGHDVHGVDPEAGAIEAVRGVAAALRPDLPPENFRCTAVEDADFPEESFDVVLSVAVLHFAEDHDHFERMLRGSWRFLRPGGLFFARLTSSIGIEDRVSPRGGGRFRLGDGSDRYLVDEEALLGWTRRLGGRLLDPIKTTNVQSVRAMTTWVVERGPGP